MYLWGFSVGPLTLLLTGVLHCMQYLYVFLGNNTDCEAYIVFNCSHMVSCNTLYIDALQKVQAF